MRYVVVSTNNNSDYYGYSKYIKHAWNKLGWKLCAMVTHDVSTEDIHADVIIHLPMISELRTESIAQAGRLYAANHLEGFLMTSDMDLLPLSDYWKPNEDEITVYGHDLTWNTYIPMGYTAMSSDNWKKYLRLTGSTEADLVRDSKDPILKNSPYSKDWDVWWGFDWDLLTKRLMPNKELITFVKRGQIKIAGADLAKGRVDRYNWRETMNQPDWIDAHCHNVNIKDPGKMKDFLDVFEKVYGKVD